MNEYDDFENEPLTREEEQTVELRLDAAQEQRQAEEEKAAEAAQPDDEECAAEFIDGSWYGDDCPTCREAVTREQDDCEECQHEDGYCSKHENGVHS